MNQDKHSKERKKIMTICIDRVLAERFKQSAQKDMRKYSNIIERYMQNYLNARS